MQNKAKYIIGIDLGTTNCTMAYSHLGEDNPAIQRFQIPQIVTSGTQEEHFSLPSFLYMPLQEELDAKTAAIDWDKSRQFTVGVYARNRGGELPGRLISSAKSWLCHSGIDRRQKILPLNSPETIEKMSPLEACSELLRHLREAWDQKMHSDAFVEQQILITVPASFDPSARQLVQEAAEKAGFPEVVLLEEPQAAFYAWLHKQSDSWRKQLKVGDHVLVIDIGGGTSDFSLIKVEEQNGDMVLERLAVGDHLLLGGDNLDLSLAYIAQSKFESKKQMIDEWQFQALVHACRQAKETLLSENAPKSVDVTIIGRGSKLIGNTLKTEITKKEAEELLVDGFIPLVDPEEQSLAEHKSGFQQIGLPYVRDPRISCQLAKFLSMKGETANVELKDFVVPSAVLFNGGTMKSAALRTRILDLLNKWANKLGKEPVNILPDPDYDEAVSCGAVYYGLARAGKGIRIRGGTSRSYYIGVEDSAPAVPGRPPSMKAICVVPFGMEEGTEQKLDDQTLALVVGQQATFRFFSHSTAKLPTGDEPQMGSIIKNWKEILTELHPIETRLEKGENDSKTIPVQLKSRVTELGNLELWCVSHDGRKWKLEFDLR